MAKYVYTMRRVSKTVPPQRTILKNISLNFFPGAKIGVLGLNGSGKSTLLRIMAGADDNYEGEVIRMPGIKVGYLAGAGAAEERHRKGGGRGGRRRDGGGEEAPGGDLRRLFRARRGLRQARRGAGEARGAGQRRRRGRAGGGRRRPAPARMGAEDRRPLRRREAPGGAVSPPAVETRFAFIGRTDQPPR